MNQDSVKNPNIITTRFCWPFVGWCLFVSPLMLVLAWSLFPGMLAGLVLVRVDEKQYIQDSVSLTTMGLFVSAFGIAIVRIFDLYGALQFGYEGVAKQIHSPVEKRTSDNWWWTNKSTAWPKAVFVLWICISCAYPLLCTWLTKLDISRIPKESPLVKSMEVDWWYAILGVLGGTFIACFFLLIISLVQLLVMRRVPSACGLLPFEDLAAKLLELSSGKTQKQIGPTATDVPSKKPRLLLRFLDKVAGPGFANKERSRILAGHQQLIAMMVFGLIAYYCLFDTSYRKSGWTSSTFPVGLYAMLLVFLVGGTVAFGCFVLGRLRLHLASIIPIMVAIVLLLLGVSKMGYWISLDSNRYFAIGPISEKKAIRKQQDELGNSTFVRIANGQVPASDESLARRLSLREVYSNWRFPVAPDGKRTMVVVTASGGGIQASAWTAKVLSNLDREFPAFSESIGLISGVSGGSVGSMYYLGHRGFRVNPMEEQSKDYMVLDEKTRQKIETDSSASSLESIGWGLAFPDLAKNIPGLRHSVSQEDDRGLALEAQWWSRMGFHREDATHMRELRMRDLIQATNLGLVPPVIFNATTVETGQRMMIASFETNRESAIAKSKGQHEQNFIDYERYMSPIDFFGFYEPLFRDPKYVNPRISTAVRLSASFAYVTPVARPILPKEHLIDLAQNSALLRRGNYHLCDGGYSDNTGLVAAVSVITDLIDQYLDLGEKPPFDRILFLSIEAFPDNAVEVNDDETGLSSGFLGPLNAIFNARVASQAERSELELDLLIRADDTTFSEMNVAEQMAVFDVEAYQNYQELVNRLVTKLRENDSLAVDLKNQATELLEPILNTQLRTEPANSKSIPASQARNLKKKAIGLGNSIDLFHSLQERLPVDDKALTSEFLTVTKALANLDVAEASPVAAAKSSAFSVEIAGIPFRFSPSEETAECKYKLDKQIPNPPLSWMLAPYDKYRIELAWKNQLAKIKGTLGTASSAKPSSKSGRKVTPPERLGQFLKFGK